MAIIRSSSATWGDNVVKKLQSFLQVSQKERGSLILVSPSSIDYSEGRREYISDSDVTSSRSNSEAIELPVELLCEIFFHVCFHNPIHPFAPYIEPCPRSGPLLLCQVSHQWRQIALHSPQLWNSLYIHNRNPALPLLKLWIERSRDLPFSFLWDFGTKYSLDGGVAGVSHGYKNRAEEVLYAPDMIKRWNDVCFYAPEKEPEEVVRHEFRAPLRENLIMTHYAWQTVPQPLTNQSISTGFDIEESLLQTSFAGTRKTLLWTPENFDMPRFISLPLTHIKIGTRISLYGCLALFYSCPNAVEMSIDWVEDPGIVSFGADPTVHRLNHLQRLIIGAAPFDLTLLLDRLSCPSLMTLRLGTRSYDSRSPVRLSRFLERACRSKSMSSSSGVSYSGSTSSVREVILVDCELGSNVMGYLAIGALRAIEKVLVLPGPLSSDERALAKVELEKVLLNGLSRRVAVDVVVPNDSVGRSCVWFGWVRKDGCLY